MTASIFLISVAAAAAVSILAVGALRRRAPAHAATSFKAIARVPGRTLATVSEKARLRLAATLLDFGNHLMLPADERKAFRLRKRLSSARARRLGVVASVAVEAGARRLDDVTLEIPIGERAQEDNPGRTLVLSCVVYEPSPGGTAGGTPEHAPWLFWRVVNRASPGYRGPSVTVEVTDLERALICYHARPLRLAGGGAGARFFDEDLHDETVA